MAEPAIQLMDVNALVALCLTSHQHHRAAHTHLAQIPGRWATCPTTEAGVTRLLLNPLVTGRQRSAGEVSAVIAGFRRDSRWIHLEDDTTLAAAHIDTSVLMGHQQVTDVWLVNLAARHSAVLATFDTGFTTWLAPADRRHVLVIDA